MITFYLIKFIVQFVELYENSTNFANILDVSEERLEINGITSSPQSISTQLLNEESNCKSCRNFQYY